MMRCMPNMFPTCACEESEGRERRLQPIPLFVPSWKRICLMISPLKRFTEDLHLARRAFLLSAHQSSAHTLQAHMEEELKSAALGYFEKEDEEEYRNQRFLGNA